MQIRRLAVLGTLVACAPVEWDQLPQSEKDVLLRCGEAIYPSRCGDDKDVLYATMCRRTSFETYAALPSHSDREDWLIQNGCPPAMVKPRKHAGPTRHTEAVVPVPILKDGFDPQSIRQLASAYDEFKDRTTTTTSTSLGEGMTLYLFAISRGRSASAHVTSMRLGISEESEKAKHQENPSLIFLVDHRRVIARNVSRHEVVSPEPGRVIGTISTSISTEDLKAMVAASEIRGQFDSTEFNFTLQARSDVRAFAERIGAAVPASTRDGSEYWMPERSK